MLKTESLSRLEQEESRKIRLVALKKIQGIITVDPITDEDTWHRPKKVGDIFDFPEKNARVLIKRRLAEEV